jgi:hypothetical protein
MTGKGNKNEEKLYICSDVKNMKMGARLPRFISQHNYFPEFP